MRAPLSIGLIGLDQRGLNLAHAFDGAAQADLQWVCDDRPPIRLGLQSRFPSARVTGNFTDLLDDEWLDAVVIATPTSTHFRLAAEALEADKHVLVENSVALTSAQADQLANVAMKRNRCLMAGQAMLFQPAVRKLKELVDHGMLGDVFHLHANRQSLPQSSHEESALWCLGAQEIAVLLYLLDDQPVEVSARGESYLQPGIIDVAFCYLRFATGVTAQLHLSWLDPQQRRRLTIVGSGGAAVIDDELPGRQLTLYEKAAGTSSGFGLDEPTAALGEIVCPRLPADEPLRLECEHFVSAVWSVGLARTQGRRAAELVGILEALQRSLDNGGRWEPLADSIHTPAPAQLLERPRLVTESY